MKKIHIGGVYYGLHNIGDEAILQSIIDSFNEFQMSVSSFDSSWIKYNYRNIELNPIRVDYVKPKLGLFIDPKKRIITNSIKLLREFNFYKSKDFYICGGATILSDCPWFSLKTVEIAGLSGTPVVLWAVGIADGLDNDAKRYIKKVLNKKYVKKIYTRDEFAKDRLVKIGVNHHKINVCYDAAIRLTPSDLDLSKYLTEKQKKQYMNNSKNVVFSLSGEADVVNRTPVDEICSVILKILEKYKCNIFLVPTGCGKHCKDLKLLKTIKERLNNDNIIVIEKEFSPEDLIAFLKEIEVIVSSRLHLNILGACSSTPSIGLVRNSKLVDFAKIIKNPYVSLDDFNSEELLKQIDLVISNREAYVKSLDDSVCSMREQYERMLLEVKDIMI